MTKKRNYHYINDRELQDRITALKFTVRRQKSKREKLIKSVKECKSDAERLDVRQKIDSIEQTIIMTEMEFCYADRELEHRTLSKELYRQQQEKIRSQQKAMKAEIEKEEEGLPDQNHPMFQNEVPGYIKRAR